MKPTLHSSAPENPPSPDGRATGAGPARYIMIGGFLGAGKTTSVACLARQLTRQGLRVGLITNDQGSELVDTAMLRSRGFATEEIPGGCFCCRFNSLVEAARRLNEASKPDVFIAEPVGSCTDLVATVSYPLRRLYGDRFTIAPLSVLVDPIRALRLFGLEPGSQFSPKVTYIYRKQLEEADLIIVNKRDLLDPERLKALENQLRLEFPKARLLQASARHGEGLEAWFQILSDASQEARVAMEVDYDLYAEGEALLGWLNATVRLAAKPAVESGRFLERLAKHLQARLQQQGAEIAHLKMTLAPDGGFGELATVNLIRNDHIPELSQELEEPVSGGQLIVNLRAEAGPDLLKESLTAALAQCESEMNGLALRMEHLENFRPGRPTPTHRLTTVES